VAGARREAGSGITAESNAEEEERETRAKAAGIEEAMGLSSAVRRPGRIIRR
jgi:anthranilate/para-aminobenzoate synthase component I